MRGLGKLFLPGSQSRWLRERATRYAFVRRSVSRHYLEVVRVPVDDQGREIGASPA
jgi:hypothetical protein